MSTDLLCPLPDCSYPLHLHWHISYGLLDTDLHEDLLPRPEHGHTSTWQVECGNGHVVLLPGLIGCGCDDAGGPDCEHDELNYDWSEDSRIFARHDADRLFALLHQLTGAEP